VAPSARQGATLTWIGEASFLLFGGYDGNAFLNDLYVYNIGNARAFSKLYTYT